MPGEAWATIGALVTAAGTIVVAIITARSSQQSSRTNTAVKALDSSVVTRMDRLDATVDEVLGELRILSARVDRHLDDHAHTAVRIM